MKNTTVLIYLSCRYPFTDTANNLNYNYRLSYVPKVKKLSSSNTVVYHTHNMTITYSYIIDKLQ